MSCDGHVIRGDMHVESLLKESCVVSVNICVIRLKLFDSVCVSRQ